MHVLFLIIIFIGKQMERYLFHASWMFPNFQHWRLHWQISSINVEMAESNSGWLHLHACIFFCQNSFHSIIFILQRKSDEQILHTGKY